MFRIGIGYDIHPFGRAKGPVRLGGIDVPHPKRLAGHSDADALLHALTDALLGAIGAPDIGELFPPSHSAYRNKDSRWFVAQANARVRKAGWRVGNVDTIVIADAPRLTGYKARMSREIARLLGVAPSAVSVKAKTTEGFPPARRGIAAQAVVLLVQGRGKR